MRVFGRSTKVCVGCEAKEAIIKNLTDYNSYLQKLLDRMLLERGLPPIKNKKLKIEEVPDAPPPEWEGKEVYGVP